MAGLLGSWILVKLSKAAKMPDKLPGSETHRSKRYDRNMTLDMTGEDKCLQTVLKQAQAKVFTLHVRVAMR